MYFMPVLVHTAMYCSVAPSFVAACPNPGARAVKRTANIAAQQVNQRKAKVLDMAVI